MNIKKFFKDRLAMLKLFAKGRLEDLKAYPIDAILMLFGIVVLVVGITIDKLFIAFMGIVLAMYCLYTVFRLNNGGE